MVVIVVVVAVAAVAAVIAVVVAAVIALPDSQRPLAVATADSHRRQSDMEW